MLVPSLALPARRSFGQGPLLILVVSITSPGLQDVPVRLVPVGQVQTLTLILNGEVIVPRVGQPPFLRGQAVVALDTKERETVQFLGNEPRSGSKTTTTHGPDFALHSVRRSFTRIHAIVGSGEFHRGGSPLNDPPLARAGRDAVGDSKAMRCDR